MQPEFVMKILYPLAEVPTYGGTTIQFDDTVYEAANDQRADGAAYNEVQSGYTGGTFKLGMGGLRYVVTHKRRKEMENLNINWGAMAASTLANKAGLAHEMECAIASTTFGNYASTHRIALSAGSRFGDASVDPDPIIRAGKTAIANRIGLEPNVGVMGRAVFDALCTKYAKNFTTSMATTGPGLRQQLSLPDLAVIFGLQKMVICDANVKVAGGAMSKVFGNHLVLARVHPQALTGDALPYKPTGQINIVEPSFGYTYVMQGHPSMYAPWEDKHTKSMIYDLDFDRQVRNIGADAAGALTYGYLIQNAA